MTGMLGSAFDREIQETAPKQDVFKLPSEPPPPLHSSDVERLKCDLEDSRELIKHYRSLVKKRANRKDSIHTKTRVSMSMSLDEARVLDRFLTDARRCESQLGRAPREVQRVHARLYKYMVAKIETAKLFEQATGKP